MHLCVLLYLFVYLFHVFLAVYEIHGLNMISVFNRPSIDLVTCLGNWVFHLHKKVFFLHLFTYSFIHAFCP